MLATAVFFSGDGARSLRRHLECAGALLLLLVVSLITTSCGTVAAAPPVGGQPLALSGALPAGAVNQPYNAVLSVGGGTSPYHFAIASGTLPPGVNLNPITGSFTGQPTSSGTYSFKVTVNDSPLPDQGAQSFIVQVKNSVVGGGGGGGIKVSVSPANVTLSSGGTQQFTATVTGTPDTAVSWSATAGTTNANGLYTAPIVKTTVYATVTATSQANPSQAASASVTINPGQGGQTLQITTSSLPQGLQGETYAATFTASGGTQPYSWNVSSGKLPPGLALSTNGDLSGVPTATGTFSFSVTVTDAANHTASGNFNLTIASGSGYDGPAQLPLVTVPTSMADTPAPGAVVNVKAGADLQAAFNSMQCGQTIQLQAGATFTGRFTLPAKNCDNQHWIIIRTSSPDSALPQPGQRLTPCYAGVASLPGRPAYPCSKPTNVLATVQDTNLGPILIANGASFYRLIGLEITRAPAAKNSGILIYLDGTADHIIVDRSWLHGQLQDETRNGFGTSGGTYIAVIDSYFNDFHCISGTGSCTDSHAISGGMGTNQDGPYLIQNNFLEASGEAVLFGGGAATKTPTDITIRGNHFFKPMQWMKGNVPFVGSPDGHAFIVKNHLEFKNAVRVLAEANLMENVWGGFTQYGHAILITPKNQHTKSGNNVCPNCQVTDVTIRYTRISHAGAGMVMATAISAAGNGGAPALAGARYSIHDVVMDDLSTKYVGGGAALELAQAWPKNPLNSVTINHLTAFPDPESHVIVVGNGPGDPPMTGLIFTNNLMVTGRYPVWDAYGGGKINCATGDVPITSINNCFTTNTFQTNGLIASPPHFPPSSWPSGNYFPGTPADVQFVNFNNGNGGNYQLLSGSPYKNAGTDGKDLGADIVGLNAALAGVE